MAELNASQIAVVDLPLNTRIFATGPAGCGKTTAAVERMLNLIKQGVPGHEILIITPQRTLQEPFLSSLEATESLWGGQVTPATVGGLARRVVDLFWPLAVDQAGFAHPDRPPVFLTLETAQYYMAHLVRPLLDEGFFDSVTIDRNRLYGQILDNLNKSAVIGFPYTEIGERLDSAWQGDTAQRRVYADAQHCASLFRSFCLEHNLLDFSLQFQIFWEHLWPDPLVQSYLLRSYNHLIYDNVEEDFPRAHDLMSQWLPMFDSALLIYDEGGGYRQFLGADPDSGSNLEAFCNVVVEFEDSFVVSETIIDLQKSLVEVISPTGRTSEQPKDILDIKNNWDGTLEIIQSRFYPELLDSITDRIQDLIFQSGVSASEIVILAPYLSDALRFSIMNRLQTRGVPVRSHRPSRSLRDEPASQALLTLAALAHPGWGLRPSRFDVAYAFMVSLDMDLVRAQLLAEILYRTSDYSLAPFDGIKSDVQERISFVLGNRYSILRDWILENRNKPVLPLDHFLRRLFGEVLSQPGFGFHHNFDAVRVAANLVESIYKFRISIESTFKSILDETHHMDMAVEYIHMLQDGVISAQYLEGWRKESNDAVLVAPAYTFLMMNKPAAIQFWLDPGSGGWHERLSQPLTHPYVLSRHWNLGRIWTDADETAAGRDSLTRLVSGLLLRCREKVILGLPGLSESGFEQRGVLIKSIQRVLMQDIR